MAVPFVGYKKRWEGLFGVFSLEEGFQCSHIDLGGFWVGHVVFHFMHLIDGRRF